LKGFRAGHFGLRHRVVSFISQVLFANYTYTIRHGLAQGMRRKGGLGFVPISPGETPETKFLRELPLEGKVVYDVGAFEGVLMLFFARKAKQVISWEPNPRNFNRCTENMRLNRLQNVQLNNRGVSDRAGSIDLIYDPLMPGAGSGEKAIADQIGSSVKTAQKLTIPVLRLDDDVAQNNFPPPDLIKIDIEGMEFPALKGMEETIRSHRPALFIEMHGATAAEKMEIAHSVIGLLESWSYKSYDVESGCYLTVATLGELRPGHLYCTCE
jgi:FkbM family methyltransferase